MCYNLFVDKRLTRFSSLEAMKRAERDAWRQVSPAERIRAVTEITMALYAMKGSMPDVPRLQRTLVRIKRA